MKYKVTRQYARDEEKPLAEFHTLNDARLFIEKKSIIDQIQKIKLIYRIFDENKLLAEFNKNIITIPISRAQFAQEDKDLPTSFLNSYKVIIKPYEENIHSSVAEFNNINDAKIFVETKLTIDISNNSNVTYGVFNNTIFIEEWNQGTIEVIKQQTQDLQGKPRAISFRPTPLSTTPQPPGSPPRWIIDEDDNDKNGKK